LVGGKKSYYDGFVFTTLAGVQKKNT